MFFRAKPIPPEWSHLTPEEVKLCRKALKKSSGSQAYYVFKDALAREAYGALPIILGKAGVYADDAISTAMRSANSNALKMIIPVLSGVEPMYQRFVLCHDRLVNHAECLPEILERITNKDYRAEAMQTLLSNQKLADFALCHVILEAGVNVHYEEGNLLYLAVTKAQFSLAEKIIASDFDLSVFGVSVYQRLIVNGAPPEAMKWYKDLMQEKGLSLSAVHKKDNNESGFQLLDDNRIKAIEKLGPSSTLTRVFNFFTGEQVMYVTEGGSPSAPVMSNVSSISPRLLESAMAAFVDQGGDATLLEPFSANTAIAKPRTPQLRSPENI